MVRLLVGLCLIAAAALVKVLDVIALLSFGVGVTFAFVLPVVSS